jgi:hypothetical protein
MLLLTSVVSASHKTVMSSAIELQMLETLVKYAVRVLSCQARG